MVLNDLLNDTLGRIEEGNPPIFWSLTNEVFVQMVYSLFEVSILTGTVQLNRYAVNLPTNTTYIPLQGGMIPKGTLAAFRLLQTTSKGLVPVKKTTLKALDDINPGWQQEAPATSLISWFPMGVSMFGLYPQLSAPLSVSMDFIRCPVNASRPYTGFENIPLQTEFADVTSKYAGMLLRSKEGGAEAEEGDAVYKEYMAEIKNLSLFQQRIDSLVASLAWGFRSGVNPRTLV